MSVFKQIAFPAVVIQQYSGNYGRPESRPKIRASIMIVASSGQYLAVSRHDHGPGSVD
jgi:hypothetical protein